MDMFTWAGSVWSRIFSGKKESSEMLPQGLQIEINLISDTDEKFISILAGLVYGGLVYPKDLDLPWEGWRLCCDQEWLGKGEDIFRNCAHFLFLVNDKAELHTTYMVDPEAFSDSTNSINLKQIDHKGKGAKLHILEDFSHRIGKNKELKNLGCEIYPNELIGVYGPSGCGKSTLNALILGIRDPVQKGINGKKEYRLWVTCESGNKEVHNKALPLLDGTAAFLPQSLDFLPEKLTVGQFLCQAAADRGASQSDKEIKRRLLQVGLDVSDQGKRISYLSGGQKKKLGLAAVLSTEHSVELLIVDEPTSGLDMDSEEEVIRLLRKISRRGTTVLVTTHSRECLPYFDRILLLNKTDKSSELAYLGRPDETLLRQVLRGEDFGTRIVHQPSPWLDNLDARSTEIQKSPDRKWSISSQWEWIKNTWVCHYRDWKLLSIIIGITFLAALTLYLSVGGVDSPEKLFYPLSTIALAWLSATYGIIYASKLFKFFCFQRIGGSTAIAFLMGMIVSASFLMIILSLIFSVFSSQWMQEKRDFETLAIEYHLDDFLGKFTEIRKDASIETALYKAPAPEDWGQVGKLTLAYFVLAISGLIIGFALFFWRKKETPALLACVALFIFYICYSRATVLKSDVDKWYGIITSRSEEEGAKPSEKLFPDLEQAFHATVSFFSLGRHAAPLVKGYGVRSKKAEKKQDENNQDASMPYLHIGIFSLLFVVTPFCLAWLSLRPKDKLVKILDSRD